VATGKVAPCPDGWLVLRQIKYLGIYKSIPRLYYPSVRSDNSSIWMVSEMVQAAATDEVFHALSNPTRRKVLERLSVGPATVSELAAPFDMQLPSFVQHLSVLEQSRLEKSRKRGRVRTYEIAPERLKVAEDWLTERRRLWEARLDRFDHYVKQLKQKESEK
jgi:DNA-binding transcriptional ArsR family regulator